MKLKQGDYLPVSEIKTEQDFNNVIKAAENCGFDAPFVWELDRILNGVFIANDGCLWMNPSKSRELNQLTLSQWLERCGVKPESKEIKLFNGQECIVLFEGKNQSVIQYLDDTGTEDFVFTENIKPLKSKADQEREDFINDLIDLIEKGQGLKPSVVANAIYSKGFRKVKPLNMNLFHKKLRDFIPSNFRDEEVAKVINWLRDNGYIVTEGE